MTKSPKPAKTAEKTPGKKTVAPTTMPVKALAKKAATPAKGPAKKAK